VRQSVNTIQRPPWIGEDLVLLHELLGSEHARRRA
jgi:hypothetical protein